MKIAVIEPLGISQEQLMSILEAQVGEMAEIVYYSDRKEDVPTLIERSKDADIVVVSNIAYPRIVMQDCPKLKAIIVAFTGVDHVDLSYCEERGITVCNCAGYSTSAVADLVFGMIIGFYRNIAACDEQSRHGGTKDGLIGFELEGKKFGIVGAGAIGSRVASIANAFGCEVYCYSRTPKPIPNVSFVSFDELLSTCDIISLHVPATKETHHMIGEWELQRMKKDAVLINTARGPVVDDEALAKALVEEEIAGACIDVLDHEPPFDKTKAILHAPHTIITPHIAFASKQAMVKRAHIVAKNLQAYLQGNPINVIRG